MSLDTVFSYSGCCSVIGFIWAVAIVLLLTLETFLCRLFYNHLAPDAVFSQYIVSDFVPPLRFGILCPQTSASAYWVGLIKATAVLLADRYRS